MSEKLDAILVGMVALVAVTAVFVLNAPPSLPSTVTSVAQGIPHTNLGGQAGSQLKPDGSNCNRHWECLSGYCLGANGDRCNCNTNTCVNSVPGGDYSKCGISCERCEMAAYRKCATPDLSAPVGWPLSFTYPDGSSVGAEIKNGVEVSVHLPGSISSESSWESLFGLPDYVGPAWFLDGQKIGTSALRLVGVGRYWGYTFEFKYTFNVPGLHTLKMVLDPDNNVKESNENNNKLVQTLVVSGGCTPSCGGKSCGAPDGCNGKCQGSCPNGQSCQNGACVSSTPNPQTPPLSPLSSGSGCHDRGGTCPYDNDGRNAKSVCPAGKTMLGQTPDCTYCCIPNGSPPPPPPKDPNLQSVNSCPGTCQWQHTCPSGGTWNSKYSCTGERKYCCM